MEEQKQSKTFLVTGNEDLRNKNLFLENLLFYKKQKGENPLLVNLIQNNNCFSGEPVVKGKKQRTDNFFKLHTELDISSITGEDLVAGLKGKDKDKIIESESGFTSTYILGSFPQESVNFYNCIDHIVFLVKNEYESSSYLYSFINTLYDKMIGKNMGIIVSDAKRLEDGARFFIRLRDEMRDMIDKSLAFDFIGTYNLDIGKVSFAAKRGLVYIRIFEDDIFHGNIKYIYEKLHGLEYFKTGSFFRETADFISKRKE